MRYQPIPHTADIGFKVQGKDLAELFSNAAFALTDSMLLLSAAKPTETISVELQAESVEELLVKWLEEILFLFETRNFVSLEFHFEKCSRNNLKAKMKGREWDEKDQPLKTQIKAVTFHELEIVKTPKGYETQVILDV